MKAIVFDNFKDKFFQLNKYLKLEEVNFTSVKFKNGEGKITINESLKGEDVIVFSDFSHPCYYKYLGKKRLYSKDEYCMELKRVISAIDDAKSITVYLPLIYQSRQNANKENESKDYLLFINELRQQGVDKIVTFESHGEENLVDSYSLANLFKDFHYDVVVSPDKGGVERSEEYSKILHADNTHFDKVRNLSMIVDGANPIDEYQKSDYDFNNKHVLIVDDILDSGNTLINAINSIENANKIDAFVAYPLFSKGIKELKKLVKQRKLNRLYISNLIYIPKEIRSADFIEVINVDEYIANVIKKEVQQ